MAQIMTNGVSSRKGRGLLVVQAAGLGWDLVSRHGRAAGLLPDLAFAPLEPAFPAVTCTAQATFRTAAEPARHGIVANGWLERATRKTAFWEQSARLVEGPRIWDGLRARGGRVALLCWQQSLGERADIVLSPAPIHKHHGGMVQDCYGDPPEIYPALAQQLGGSFRLSEYWGPRASARSSRWIARATCALLSGSLAPPPDLCLSYLPALDYDLQRFGPDHPRALRALRALAGDLALLRQACDRHGYDLLLFGDYAIETVGGEALHPNRALRAAGLLRTRAIGRRRYLDPHASRAFAVVDHQVAHVYVRDAADIAPVREALLALPGAGEALDAAGQALRGVAHARCGELLLTAAPGHWLAYPWWEEAREAPDFAGHVDIHNKPGYDPCELFWGWPPGAVSCDTRRPRGTHGLAGAGHEACWASTCLPSARLTLRQLAEAARAHLETMI
jgi:hypothetical protein